MCLESVQNSCTVKMSKIITFYLEVNCFGDTNYKYFKTNSEKYLMYVKSIIKYFKVI